MVARRRAVGVASEAGVESSEVQGPVEGGRAQNRVAGVNAHKAIAMIKCEESVAASRWCWRWW